MSNVECFYCGEKGHMQTRCPQFREDLKSLRVSKGKKKVDEENANLIYDDDDLFTMEVANDGTSIEENKWVLDSAASVHICKDRVMFDTMCIEEQLGEIKVGNNENMKIEGVGSVRFKLHDGSVRTALNVKYVPNATTNVLSLGVLTSRGYRYVGRRQMCKVYKGKRLILQGRKSSTNLCYLDGNSLLKTCVSNKKKQKTEKKRKVSFFGC